LFTRWLKASLCSVRAHSGERKLTKSQLGQAEYHKSPESPGPPVQVPAARASKGNVVSFPPTLASAISCTVRIRINASSMLSLSVGQAGTDLV